jgi:hypothetical protein
MIGGVGMDRSFPSDFDEMMYMNRGLALHGITK